MLGRDRERALAGPAGRAPCASAADVSCGAQVAEMVHFMENSNFFWAIKFLLSSTALPNVLKDSNSWKEKTAVVLRTGGTACDSEPPCEPGAERGDHGPLGSEDPASSPRALGPPSRLRAVGALVLLLTPAAPRTRGQTLRAGAAASASCGRLPSSNGRGPQHTGEDVSSRALKLPIRKGPREHGPRSGRGRRHPAATALAVCLQASYQPLT